MLQVKSLSLRSDVETAFFVIRFKFTGDSLARDTPDDTAVRSLGSCP